MVGQVIWITGLSGAGKTTLAKETVVLLRKHGLNPILLDGDPLRKILNSNTQNGSEYDRDERVKIALKYAHICQLLSSQGFTVVIATISMFKEVYLWNQRNLAKYFEVYLKVPVKELRSRDPKNIYKRFYCGDLINVAGLDLVIDEPTESNMILDFELQPTAWKNPTDLANRLVQELKKVNLI